MIGSLKAPDRELFYIMAKKYVYTKGILCYNVLKK